VFSDRGNFSKKRYELNVLNVSSELGKCIFFNPNAEVGTAAKLVTNQKITVIKSCAFFFEYENEKWFIAP
jgi:hypothetical protein